MSRHIFHVLHCQAMNYSSACEVRVVDPQPPAQNNQFSGLEDSGEESVFSPQEQRYLRYISDEIEVLAKRNAGFGKYEKLRVNNLVVGYLKNLRTAKATIVACEQFISFASGADDLREYICEISKSIVDS